MTRRPRRSAEENEVIVLDAAAQLFYAEGIRAVGVERIAQAAGVAPATLYRAYRSKDDLVAAYVEQRDDAWRSLFRAAVDSAASSDEAIVAVFDAALAHAGSGDYRGCAFLMALAEFRDPGHPANRAAIDNKRWVRDQFAVLCAALDPGCSPSFADELTVLLEGLYASSQELGVDGPASAVPAFVRRLVEGRQNPSARPHGNDEVPGR